MKNLEFLGNLNQLLVNAIAHGHMTREECRFDERTAKLRQALEAIVQNPNRPNNSLEAQAALLRIRLNQAMIADDSAALSDVWRDFAPVVERADGLGEFDADRLVSFIEVAGQAAGNDPAYNNLCPKRSQTLSASEEVRVKALLSY